VRPEYVAITGAPAADALRAVLVNVKSIGAFRIATVELGGRRLKAKMRADAPIPVNDVFVRFAEGRRLLYANDRLVAVA
jgi:glycerol transport system ATP-binding protein